MRERDTKEEWWRGGQSTGFLSFSPVVSSQALFPWQPPAGDRETAVKRKGTRPLLKRMANLCVCVSVHACVRARSRVRANVCV